MTAKTSIQILISETNAKKLERLCIEQGARKGVVVDEALTLLFLPPLERPEAVLLQQVKRVEKKLDHLDASMAFQADLFVEFLFAWLKQSPGPHPLRSPTDDARAGADLEALMKRVADRSNPFIWS
jgi:hypothetical protein